MTPIDVIPISKFKATCLAVAMESRRIVLPHQDPADRFIAASAIVYGPTLVTTDRHLIENAELYTVFPNL